MFEVSVEHSFAAAHFLRNYHGKCEHMHGHNWKVQVTLRGETLDQAGMLYDFVVLKKSVRELLEVLDHKVLNEVRPFDELNPSAENIAWFIGEEIRKGLGGEATARVTQVRVWETDTSVAAYIP